MQLTDIQKIMYTHAETAILEEPTKSKAWKTAQRYEPEKFPSDCLDGEQWLSVMLLSVNDSLINTICKMTRAIQIESSTTAAARFDLLDFSER